MMKLELIWKVFLLSMTPIGECRASIPYGIYNGLSPMETFILSLFGNSLMGILIYLSINFLSKNILNKEPLKTYYSKFINNKLRKLKIYHKSLFFSLIIFIAIPLPGTGAFTGAILSRILGLSFRETLLTISLGVSIASLIIIFLTLSSTLIFI